MLALAGLFMLAGLPAGAEDAHAGEQAPIEAASEAIREHLRQDGRLPFLEGIVLDAAIHAPAMLRQELVIAENDASYVRSRSRYLPEVDLRYDVGAFYEERDSISSDEQLRGGVRAELRATQPLFWWGAYDAERRRIILEEEIAEVESVVAYARLAESIRAGFYELLVQAGELDMLERRRAFAQNRLERTEILAERGEATKTRLAEARLENRSLRYEAERARLDFTEALNAFRRRTGKLDLKAETLRELSREPLALPEIDLPAMRARLEAFRGEGFARSAPSRAAEAREEAVRQEIIIERADQRPLFNLGAGVRQQPYENIRGDYELQTLFFLGITGQWNLFDRFETRENIRSLRVRRRLIDAERATTRDRLVEGARSFLNRIDLARARLGLLQTRRELLGSERDLVARQLEQGTAGELDLQAAEEALLINAHEIQAARAEILSARTSFLTSVFEDPAVYAYRSTLE